MFASIDATGMAFVMARSTASGVPMQTQSISFTLDPNAPEDALAAAARVLAQPPWKSTIRHVVLSDLLVRYLVVDRPLGVRSLSELELSVNARFEQAFDLSVAQWTIAIDARPCDRQFIACAMPRPLLTAIKNIFCDDGRCASIRPFLVCELNRRAQQMPQAGWYAAATDHNLCLIAFAQGRIERIRSLPTAIPTAAEVERLVARERLLAGDDALEQPTLFSGVLNGSASSALTRIDSPQWGSKNWSSQDRMAMAGVWP